MGASLVSILSTDMRMAYSRRLDDIERGFRYLTVDRTWIMKAERVPADTPRRRR